MIIENQNKTKSTSKSISLCSNKNFINSKNILNINQYTSSNPNIKSSLISKIKIIKNFKNVNIKKKLTNQNKLLFKNKKDISTKLKQNIGINTIETSEKFVQNKSEQEKSLMTSVKEKSKINEDFNTSSSIYKQYFVGYNKNGEFIDNEKIRELRRNLKSFSVNNNKLYKYFPYKKNKNIIQKKGTLLTYNFNKNAYSNSQRLLLNIHNNNNIINYKNNKLIYKLKRQKTAGINNYKSLNYPNINTKSMSNRNTASLNNSFLNKIEADKNDKERKKKIKKYEILKMVEEPNSLLHYIYNKSQEYKEHKILLFKNRKKGNRFKLENMKNDLKLIEQETLYQLFNLRYKRIPGDEINIKTNIFCTK